MRSTFLGILLLIFSMPATTDNLGRHAGGYFGGGVGLYGRTLTNLLKEVRKV